MTGNQFEKGKLVTGRGKAFAHVDRRRIHIITLMIVAAASILAVILLMDRVKHLLESDLRVSLIEIVSQNRDAISSRLGSRIRSIEESAKKISENLQVQIANDTGKSMRNLIRNYGMMVNRVNEFVADDQGIVASADGRTVDISGRNYFRAARTGVSNISEPLVSVTNGEKIFIISVPVFVNGKPVATFQETLSYEEIQKILLPSLFTDAGAVHVTDSDGYVIVSNGQAQEMFTPRGNFFRGVFAAGNRDAAQKIERDAKEQRRGVLEVVIGGEEMFTAYMPLDRTNDWFLIVSVPASKVFQNSTVVIKLFYLILTFVVLVSLACVAYFFRYKSIQEKHMEEIAFVDPATGGATYAKFLLDVRKALAVNPGDSKLAIIKVDVDRFKYINTTFGFNVGDATLRSIYAHFKTITHPGEYVARIADDHYVLFLKSVSNERLDKLFRPLLCGEVAVQFSAGVYMVEDRQEDPRIMIDKARMASEGIKGLAYKSFAYYTPDLGLVMTHTEQIKQQIGRALEEGQFVPFFQPQVDINTNIVVGCEALARWKVADDKFISPADFIPVCEQTGLIIRLDLVILEKSLKFIQHRMQRGQPSVPISVNFSRMHFHDENFPKQLLEKVKSYGVPPSMLEIEVTEGVFFEDLEAVEGVFTQLQGYGFAIAMDDFGSGYSSLNMLKRIPINTLKIDRGFLDESSGIEKRNAIFAGVVEIARKLGLKVIVEGAEIQTDVDLMKDHGCRIAQGFYFSKPLAESDFLQLSRNGHFIIEKPQATRLLN